MKKYSGINLISGIDRISMKVQVDEKADKCVHRLYKEIETIIDFTDYGNYFKCVGFTALIKIETLAKIDNLL